MNHFIRFHRQATNVVYADEQRLDDAGETFKPLAKRVVGMFEPNADIVYGVGSGEKGTSSTVPPTAAKPGDGSSPTPSHSHCRGRPWLRPIPPIPTFSLRRCEAANRDATMPGATSGRNSSFSPAPSGTTRRIAKTRSSRSRWTPAMPKSFTSASWPMARAPCFAALMAAAPGRTSRTTCRARRRNLAVHPQTGEVFYLNIGGGLYVLARTGRTWPDPLKIQFGEIPVELLHKKNGVARPRCRPDESRAFGSASKPNRRAAACTGDRCDARRRDVPRQTGISGRRARSWRSGAGQTPHRGAAVSRG